MNVADDTIEEVLNKTAESKNMSDKKLYYYRIFDDKEKLNYVKSSLPHDKVEHWLKEYERTHQKYFNPEFISFLHEHDPEAEIIEVSDISY
jgi:hypothetical protein